MSLELSKKEKKTTTIQVIPINKSSNTDIDTKMNTNNTDTIIELQLGDVIKIQDPKNEKLNENTFLIDYIDKTHMKLLNAETLFFVELKINEEGVLGDGTITNIYLLSRSPEKGYARQNGLLRGTWVNISFEYDVPLILTAEITNLEEDMIELTTFPEGDVLYINFDYKGIPEDIPIKTIEIRGSPEKPKLNPSAAKTGLEEKEMVGLETGLEPGLETGLEPGLEPELGLELEPEIKKKREMEIETIQDVRTQIREMILKADQIQFGEEELGPIFQYVDVDPNKQRYSIEAQTNDLQNELLSTIPTINRTSSVLNNIHTMIERFKQLREYFSVFDNYGNISPNVNEANLKPLEKYFLNFREQLLWILPVVENTQIFYNIDNDDEDDPENTKGNYIQENMKENLTNISDILYNYKSNRINGEENKYSTLFTELNPFFTPFVSVNDETNSSIISEKPVKCDLNVLIDNLDNLSTYAVKNVGPMAKTASKRFFLEKYNTGLTKLDATNFTGSQMTSERTKLTNPDIMSIKSFVTLPEPMIRYSRILLPGTSLIDKANLNLNFLNYWQLLNTYTRVQDILIDDLQMDYPYTENTFANNIKQFILNVPEEERKSIGKEKLYEQFIQSIIPKIKILFQLMKKYMNETVSILNIVEYLEPFLVYSDNLTYMQYNEITKFIDEKISDYNKKYIEKSREFSKLKRKNDYSINKKDIFSLLNLLEDKNKDTLLNDDYQIQEIKDVFIGNSETLRKIILKDCGKLYTTVLTFQNMKLMYPDEFTSVFDNQKSELGKAIDQFKDSKGCKNIIISKFYVTEEELMLDNEKEIYFDKRYDSTNYGFIDDYEREMISMEPEKFIEFLIKKIKEKLKISQDAEAEYLAETLLSGHKLVKDSNYAILYDKNMELNENEEYKYYIRKNNKWVLDPFVNDKDIISDQQNVLCNMQPSCISVPTKTDDKCENIKLNELKLEDTYLKDILTQFDEQYSLSLKDFKEKMERKMINYENVFVMLTKLENDTLLKYNNEMYELGLSAIDSTNRVISPYAKLLDLILGEPDFVKKQHNIIEFTTRFTRTAIENTVSITGVKETPWWLYCNQTNTELLPTFMYQMACAYINTPDEYVMFVQKLIKEIGEKSEDGDYWVDKHSGRQIIYIGFSTEEGYEEGFRVSTRDVLEKDAGEEIMGPVKTASSSSIQPKYITDEMKIIINIINALSVSMGINIEPQKEFIINAVLESIQSNLESEVSYKKKIKEMANKGTLIPSYTALYNATILFYTLGMFLIAVQTNVPSIKSKKTFPGCVKSFTGYPFEGAGDMSSLNYLACIAYKIKSAADPWNALSKMKEISVAAKIKNAVDSLLELAIVKSKINEKTIYLLSEPTHEVPDAHDILNWQQFLPPLVPFKITNLINISGEFKNKLLNDLKYGSPKQIDQISVIQSKNIQFSLAIQEKIQEIVQKKKLLLNKMSGEAFLENACCNEKSSDKMTSLQYFENENASITEYNNIVKMNMNTLMDIHFYSEAITFSSRINTKKMFPIINNHFDEKTIYMAFIHFCHFKNMIPISEDLLPLCGEKPLYINKNDTDIEIIQKLKNDKKEYTEQMMLRLLQVVSRNNIIDVDISNIQLHSSISRFTDVLEHCKKDKMVDDRVINFINNALDTFNVATSVTTKESRDLNNFLIKENDSMKREIIEHITRHKGSTTTKEIKMMTDFIQNLSNWSDDEIKLNKISGDSLYNSIHYYKTCIQNLVTVYPNIILNKVDYSSIPVPNYWELSQTHTMDIKKIVATQYECLNQFYDNKTLYNILTQVQSSCKNYIQLANETPSFTSIKYKEKELKPVFDERTSRFLFEYYFLKILVQYIDLSEEEGMVVKEVTEKKDVIDIFSVDYMDEQETKKEYDVTTPVQTRVVLKGNIKDLKQSVSQLLLCFIKTMNNYKNTIQFSHKKIEDTIFKLKEKEKNMITDRLEKKTEEERDIDTVLKINKLGDWSKGLQKGLRTYDKDHYDNELEFMETMKKYEMTSGKKTNISMDEFDDFRDDYLDEIHRGEEIDRDAYDMSGMTDDYMDGNDYEGGEIENFGDYD